MRFSAQVDEQGGLRLTDPQRWAEALSRHKGHWVQIELRSPEEVYSSRQRGYWFAVVVPFFQQVWQQERRMELPYNKEDVHDVLMTTFAKGFTETPLGRSRRSLTTMDKSEVSRMIDEVREYARATYKSEIPTPEEWSGE